MVVNFFHTSAWRYASTHPFGTYSLQVVKVESVKPPSYSANEGGVSAFIYILASEGQYLKADISIFSKLLERVTSFNDVQPWNAYALMQVTLSGTVMLVSEAQLANADVPRVVTPSGMVMPFSEEQCANEDHPISFSPLGKVTLSREVQL